MSVAKGQLVGDKNGMFGKKHTDETRKKMSEKVLKAYAEGRIVGITPEIQALGVIARKRAAEETPERFFYKLTDYIVWLYQHLYTSVPTFKDDTGFEQELDLTISEPQARYWTALLQIDFDKVIKNVEDKEYGKALGTIFHVINALVPPEAGACYTDQYHMKFNSVVIQQLVEDFIYWILEKRVMLENYMASSYAINGNRKIQYLELLKRRYKSNWADNNRSVEVKQTTSNDNVVDNTLEVKIIEV